MTNKIKLGVHELEEDLLKGIAHEEVELFGNDNVKLFIVTQTANTGNHDPLYGEPVEYTYKYVDYDIKGNYSDFSTTETAGEGGEHTEWTQTLDVAVKHLEEAGVPEKHPRTGDIFGILIKGEWEYFDIVQYENDGVVSQRGFNTAIIFDLKKNTKFDPKRAVHDNEEA